MEIAKEQNIPLSYLEQIFLKLKNSGIVNAIRGPQGGFKLAKSADDITLADVVGALEGPFQPVLCSFPEKNSSQCREVGRLRQPHRVRGTGRRTSSNSGPQNLGTAVHGSGTFAERHRFKKVRKA